MIYREFTKDRLEISQLGFGCMRFPTKKLDDKDIIDEPEAIKIVRHAIENGVNYYDTAVFYHGGESEVVLGKALSGGFRERVYVADKFPVGYAKDENSMEETLDKQLEKLQTSYVDCYMLHGISKRDIPAIKEFKLIEKGEELKKKGKIKYFGFSFHDSFEALKEIAGLYDKWDFCQIQYNYLDQNSQATTKGLEFLYEKGISVIIMEPLRGGALSDIPDNIRNIFDKIDKTRSSTNWALSWLFDKKEISFILSGMSSMGQLNENIEIASTKNAGCLTDEMRDAVDKVYEAYEKRIKVGCTDCKYCMPCPKGVDIPFNFTILNSNYKLGTKNLWQYSLPGNKDKIASNCVSCKLCEPKCPQKIKISELLNEMASEYKKD